MSWLRTATANDYNMRDSHKRKGSYSDFYTKDQLMPMTTSQIKPNKENAYFQIPLNLELTRTNSEQK